MITNLTDTYTPYRSCQRVASYPGHPMLAAPQKSVLSTSPYIIGTLGFQRAKNSSAQLQITMNAINILDNRLNELASDTKSRENY